MNRIFKQNDILTTPRPKAEHQLVPVKFQSLNNENFNWLRCMYLTRVKAFCSRNNGLWLDTIALLKNCATSGCLLFRIIEHYCNRALDIQCIARVRLSFPWNYLRFIVLYN